LKVEIEKLSLTKNWEEKIVNLKEVSEEASLE